MIFLWLHLTCSVASCFGQLSGIPGDSPTASLFKRMEMVWHCMMDPIQTLLIHYSCVKKDLIFHLLCNLQPSGASRFLEICHRGKRCCNRTWTAAVFQQKESLMWKEPRKINLLEQNETKWSLCKTYARNGYNGSHTQELESMQTVSLN